MLIGAVIRKNWNENYQNKKNKYIFKDLIKCCICILGFLSVKILISRIDFIMRLQFLTQAFSVGFAYFAFKVLSAFEDFYKISKDKLWYKFISLIGALTLEIYFIQFMVISYFKDLVFPLNFLVIVFLIISLAYIINLVSSFIIRNVERVRQ
jgi:fucose 4-O-acetylase-like acetyltransferase